MSTALAIPQPVHVTAQQWEGLPEDEGVRTEAVDGYIQVGPYPSVDHQRVVWRVGSALADGCPPDLMVLPGAEIRLADDPLHVRVPDVLVVRADAGGRHVTPDQVVLAVEIVSPGSVTTDRRYKLADYAAAGIPNYWVLDIRDGSVRLDVHVLLKPGEYRLDGTYEVVGPVEQVVELHHPFPLSLDLRALVER